jgi:hypothetical protein
MKGKLIKGKHSGEYLLNMERVGYITTYESTLPYKLSLKNCQAIERGYDLDELAEEEVKLHHTLSPKAFKRGIQIGFQKALELMGDKKFTLEDMMNCWNKALKFQEHKETLGEHIQSLQQNEWDVEIEMGLVPNMDYKPSIGGGSDSHYNPMFIPQPKLDADGCLILKQI